MDTNILDNQNIYIFIDTNLYFTKKSTYELENYAIKKIIEMRDTFNDILGGNNKEMILLSPDMVFKEVYSIKKEQLNRDCNQCLKSIRNLGENQLIPSINQIKEKIDEKLNKKKMNLFHQIKS